MKNQFPKCPDVGIKEMIEFFYNEFFPNVTQEEAHFIAEVIKWDNDKKLAYMMSMSYFEDQEV